MIDLVSNLAIKMSNLFSIAADTWDSFVSATEAAVSEVAADVSQTAEAAVNDNAAGTSLIFTIAIYGVVIVLGYFLLFRGPRREQKKKDEMRETLRVGDNVVTTGGFFGKIVDVGSDSFMIEFGSNRGIRIPVRKDSVEGVREPKLTPPPREAIEDKK